MTPFFRQLTLGLVANIAMACGSSADPQAIESWAQWDIRFSVSPPEPLVIALVVDDRGTVEAAELRMAVDAALRTTLSWLSVPSELVDPAAWRPTDVTVALALPSGDDSEWLIGPQQVPALAYQTREATPGWTGALADVVREQIEGHVAAPNAVYRPIEVTSRLAQLLARAVPPIDDREAALVAASEREGGGYVAVALASAADDESPGAVTDYPMPPPFEQDYLVAFTPLIPSLQPAPCYYLDLDDEPASRLGSWIESLRNQSHYAEPLGWPCGAEWLPDFGLPPVPNVCGSGRSWCTSRPIAMDGPRAQCLVMVESRSVDEPCDAERGWIDPRDTDGVRRPRSGQNEWTEYRVCEVAQLEGAALRACRATAACDGCPSGWCRAEQLGMDLAGASFDHCPVGQHPSELRFVGGALAGADASFHVLCDLQP